MLDWRRRRDELAQEIEDHIDMETQENLDAGMSAEEARAAALRKFGNAPLAIDHSREQWGWIRVDRLMQDIRYAIRSLARVPGYTLTLVFTLALGLGSVTAMLAIVHTVLLKPVALPHPEQLVQLYAQDPPDGTHFSSHALAYSQLEALRANTHGFSGISGYNSMARPVGAADGTRVAVLTEVTTDFFAVLGVQPGLGRLIDPADAHVPVAVVNDEFWRDRLHADPHAVGSSIRISQQQRTIIGVLPAGMHFPQGSTGPAVFIPITLNAKGEDDFMIDSAAVLARLKPDVTREQALSEAQGILDHGSIKPKRDVLKAISYREFVVGDMQKPLLALLGGVFVLLLIACANAMNLQIGRAASRMPEMKVRSALGATFPRLLQQLLTECVLVSLLGAAVGACFAYATIAVVRQVYGQQFPRFDELRVPPLALAAAALLALIVGVVASLAPSWSVRRQTRPRVNATRGATRMSKVPGGLVALQIALTCVLLVVTGLFMRTVRSLQQVNLGFDPHGVTTLVVMPEDQRQDPHLSRDIETRLLRRLEVLPGVQSVTMQTAIPFSNFNFVLDGTTNVDGRPWHDGDSAHYSFVSTNFVRTSGIRLLQGRGFETQDESSASIVALVNQAFIQKYLSGREPLGATLRFHRNPQDKDEDIPFLEPMTVVGVVENEMEGADLGAPYQPMVYINYLQLPANSMLTMVFSMDAQYAIRSNLPASALAREVRSALKQEAPTMAEMSLQPMEDSIAASLSQRRLALRLVSSFGAVALILSAVGIYGVLAYSVTLRRREIGVRMALGSSRAGVTRLVMRQAATMAVLGLLPGMAAAWFAGRAVRSFLFGVQTLDPATLLSVGVVLGLISALAALLPAVRAAQVDPVETLRAE